MAQTWLETPRGSFRGSIEDCQGKGEKLMETAALILLLAGILLGISFTLACLLTVFTMLLKDT